MMMKRIIAMLLCLVMALSVVTPAVYATDDVVTYDDVYISSDSVVGDISQIVGGQEETTPLFPTEIPVTEPESGEDIPEPQPEEEAPEQKPVNTPVQKPAQTPSQVTEPEVVLPTISSECDCGYSELDLVDHADDCARKQYYQMLCEASAEELYVKWSSFEEDVRQYVRMILEEKYPQTLQELEDMWASQETGETDFTGSASQTVDGDTVVTSGIPQGSQLTVTEASSAAQTVVDRTVAGMENVNDQLFTYDISVQDEDGNDWQPEGESVDVELSLKDLDLPKYTLVNIVHVDDEGNSSIIETMVGEDGKISFETTGFSTFAGFTVDFTYGAAFYSIEGLTDILLSELFDALLMPLDAANVTDVTFTDYSLISVEQVEGDWLLTSLKAFDTQELLTFTMSDGQSYEIIVTDYNDGTKPPDITVGSDKDHDTNENNEVTWYADGDGDLSNTNSTKIGWSMTDTIKVAGAGSFIINIQCYSSVYTATTCYVKIKQIQVLDGCNLTVRLGGDFDSKSSTLTSCQLRATSTSNMFYVKNGSLTLTGTSQTGKGNCMMILDGAGNLTTANDNQPVVLWEKSTSFTASKVRFQNAPMGAIRCRSNTMKTFTMTDCIFDNTVTRPTNGGAIYLTQVSSDPDTTNKYYADIETFKLSGCQFNGNTAGDYGGAIALYGRVHDGDITASFSSCSAENGGAIAVLGSIGTLDITSSTFTSCSATNNGGAIYTSTNPYDESDSRQSRINDMVINGCTFTGCTTTKYSGGAVAITGQTNSLTIKGTTKFTNCTVNSTETNYGGGALCLGYTNLPASFNWTVAMVFTSGQAERGTHRDQWYDWSGQKRTTIGTVKIEGTCTMTNCTAKFMGGGVLIQSGACVESLSMTGTTIDGCKTGVRGSAIMFNECIVNQATLTNCTIKNCQYITGVAGDSPGGTIRTVGNTTVALKLDTCTIQNNTSTSAGGGLYWNAGNNRTAPNGSTVTCKATITGCTFSGNKASNASGGGIFCESVMEVTNCTFTGNSASTQGGGIAMGVYSNTSRMMSNGETTLLRLDANTKIYGNTANNGGGLSLKANATDSIADTSTTTHTVQFQLGGAQVYNNKATNNGGGIYFLAETYSNTAQQAEVDRFTKLITIDNGKIYDNTAGGNGGGIYMESRENTTLTVSSGEIYHNTATGNGGGIYMTGANAVCTITGGTIGGSAAKMNTAAKGGGIAISGGSSISMTGGEISYNQAYNTKSTVYGGVTYASPNFSQGGGIWLDSVGTNGIANTMTLTGGKILSNSTPGGTSSNGGGVYVGYSGAFTISNGEVNNNTAGTAWGGGIYVTKGTATVSGGTISGNTAGAGGGIGMQNEGSKVYVNNGTISGNTGTTHGGGGIFGTGSTYVKISGGTITGNHATSTVTERGNGGGVSLLNGSTIYVSDGDITGNDAYYYGGGIYADGAGDHTITVDATTKEEIIGDPAEGVTTEALTISGVYITGGDLIDNEATQGNGGGLHVHNSSTATISGGEIKENTATNGLGGGIHAYQNSVVTVSGGSIIDNSAKNGGGAAAETGSSITINKLEGAEAGGNITSNTASEYGGGLFADGATIIVSGGTIQQNTASKGGGIAAVSESSAGTVTVNGGTITTNYALQGGGIYAKDAGTTVTVNGGAITANQARSDYANVDLTIDANGNGGGVYVDGANVSVNRVGNVYGEISQNKAANGGGLYVTGGGDLTVKGGYIIENLAYDTGTAKAQDETKGTGGGIFIADGVSASDRSTFTLVAAENGVTIPVAIYDNMADYAADDVFANGNNTKLDVPLVGDMDLEGRDYPADSWVEDYPTGDPNYYLGLNGLELEQGDSTEDVVRYRDAAMALRVPVKEPTGDETFSPNEADTYVAMTLGIPGIISDVVVLDYGLSVDIDVLANDRFTRSDNVLELYVGAVPEDMKEFTQTEPGAGFTTFSTSGNEYDSSYGTLEVADGKFRYTLGSMDMAGPETLCYVVKYQIGTRSTDVYYYYSTITVIPATTIYFEEDFKFGDTNDLFIDYTETVKENGGVSTNDNWEIVGITPDVGQDVDRVTLTDEDLKTVYGYDSHYTGQYGFSMNGARKTTVYTYKDPLTGSITKQKTAAATFRFTGTGFDVVSLTSNRTGTILVNVFQLNADGSRKDSYDTSKEFGEDTVLNPYKSVFVDTYYGYTFDAGKGEWIVTDSDSESALYQIPVVNVTDLEYGTYEVEIYVAYNEWLSHGQYTEKDGDGNTVVDPKFDFYLDAVRIYAPASDGIVKDAQGNVVDTTINDVYLAHGEAWPVYQELRDLLLPTEREAEIKTLLDTVSALEIQISNTTHAVTASQKQIEDLQTRLTACQKQIEELTKSIEACTDATEKAQLEKQKTQQEELQAKLTKEKTALEEHKAELVVQFTELVTTRDQKQAELDAILEVEFQDAGAVFIDGKGGQLTVGDSTFYGPNNEIYLNPGAAITTTLVTEGTGIDSVYVGLKSMGGAGKIALYDGTTLVREIDIDSAADMYYDISGLATVTIENIGSTVVTITNVKVTHTADPYGTDGTMESVPFTVDSGELQAVLLMLTGDDVPETEPVTDPELSLSYPSLSFEDEIFYNVYFTAGDISDVVEMGLMILPSYMADGTIDDAIGTVPGYVTNGSVYMAKSEGIAAAYMGDTMYFRVYAKLSDGSYVYSEAGGYNAKVYAQTILSDDYAETMKQLVVAMVNYGAEAQKFFGHNTDALVNADLTDEQKALVSSYREGMIAELQTPEESELGIFTRVNSNFKELYPSVSFDGAFSINYYCTPAIGVDDGITLYWWDAETYASIDEFNVENATGSMEMTVTDGQYWGCVEGIAAKDMEKTYYVSCVFESEGEVITTGIISYSLGAYCQSIAAKDGDAQQAFAQATAVYGYYAKHYFEQC